MPKGDDIPKNNPVEIELLIQRARQSNLDPRDLERVEGLLRLVLILVNVLQQKNASLKQRKRTQTAPLVARQHVSRARGGIDGLGLSDEEKAQIAVAMGRSLGAYPVLQAT